MRDRLRAITNIELAGKTGENQMSEYYKYVRDGKTAVLYSPNSSRGWYTSNQRHPGMAFDADLVNRVSCGDLVGARNIASVRYPNTHCCDCMTLEIAWLPVGTVFDIEESNGAESLRMIGRIAHLVA